MICDSGDRIKESAKCLDNIKCLQSETGNVCLCSNTTTVLSERNVPKNMAVSLLHFNCIRTKYIYWIEMYMYSTVLYAH